MSRIAGRFTRVESRRRARRLVLGRLSDLPRKNCWTIADGSRADEEQEKNDEERVVAVHVGAVQGWFRWTCNRRCEAGELSGAQGAAGTSVLIAEGGHRRGGLVTSRCSNSPAAWSA